MARTGPCCEALIKAGIKKVVAAANDPNPKVAGKGFARLREAGVIVEQGLLDQKAYRQNEVFMHWMTTGKAFVALKYAMTLDGKIATATGDAKWITGVEARTKGHYLRSIYDGIIVGKNTVLKDDPELTTRLVKGKNPIRIVLDSKLSLPTTCKVFTDKSAPTILVVGAEVDQAKQDAFAKATGVRVLPVPTKAGKIDVTALLTILGKENITSVLVEGGSQVHGAFVDAKEVNRVYAFVAPKIIGGSQSITSVGGRGQQLMANCLNLEEIQTIRLGQDILITGVVVKEGA
jgi:diaminohydroxyphosphoribosylaminopyrimidine deaminase/5-amino-6-(5-phosphoribosylamino)uracil reductase